MLPKANKKTMKKLKTARVPGGFLLDIKIFLLKLKRFRFLSNFTLPLFITYGEKGNIR